MNTIQGSGMRRGVFWMLALLVAQAVVPRLAAQEDHSRHDHRAISGLGTVHFPISCNVPASARSVPEKNFKS